MTAPVRTCPERLARLGSVAELNSPRFAGFARNLNEFARPLGLRVTTTWSKIWEYPWLWVHGLGRMGWEGTRLVDLGSELSPLPWALAALGADVTLVETDPRFIPVWTRARDRLGVRVGWHIVDSHRIPLRDGEADAVTSFSVIEHQADKAGAVGEAARVLRPAGVFALSFDVCEPSMGMAFPEWNGRALTMTEFEEVVWQRREFGPPPPIRWNVEDIPGFLAWHRTTAPHHTYVVGAAILIRQ